METHSCAHGLVELILLGVHTTQSDLQIQCNPYQNSSDIFHRKNNPKIHVELQDPKKPKHLE